MATSSTLGISNIISVRNTSFYTMKTFEEFLEEKYDEINSNSNNMNPEFESARDRWFEKLDVQELIDFGEEYGKYVEYETTSNIQDKLTTDTLRLHDEFKNFNKK